jgi:hypothetical protein
VSVVQTARRLLVRLRWGDDLPRLAVHFGTDKWGDHRYAQHYHAHFAPLRRKPLRLLEIGVGGFQDPKQGGASPRMWRTYFPRAQTTGWTCTTRLRTTLSTSSSTTAAT